MNKIDESYKTFRGVGVMNTTCQKSSNHDLFANISGKVKSVAELSDMTADMTMEEYKQYLHEKISELSLDSSQKNVFYFIDITDEGFESMKNSSGYEDKVLEMIKEYFQRRVPKGYSGCTSFVVGANPEDIFIQSYSSQSPSYKRDKKSFWERRAEREKEINKQNEKYLEKKRRQEDYIGKLIQERHFVERKNFEELARVAAVKAKDPEGLDEEANLLTEKVISSYQKFSM